MEIAHVDAVPLRRELDERFANAQKWIDAREYCLVRIETRDGTVGWGECWGPIAGNRELIATHIGPWLVGKDLTNREALIDELRFRLESAYHSYVPASVVSGVDMALWDAYGRAVDASVAALLGGRRRETVRAYATGHFFRPVETVAELKAIVADEAAAHVDAGFDALKQKIGLERHFGWGPDADLALVAAVRERVGTDVTLMVDANHAYDRPTATYVARGLTELDIAFFEEPVPPRIDTYRHLHPAVEVPIATGECFAFTDPFRQLIDAGAIEYAQPDVTSAGGITSTMRIARLAHAADVPCYPHVFGSAIALAASLQVLAAIPGRPLLEFDRTPNPIRDELARTPIDHEGPAVSIPDGPGIGIRIDADVLDRYRVDRG